MFKDYRRYLKNYWRIAELHKGLFALNLFTTTLYKTFALAMPFVASLIIKYLTEGNSEAAYTHVVILFFVYLGHQVAHFLNWRVYSWNVSYSYRHMHDKMFDKLTNIDDNFTREIKKGEFMNTVNSDFISVGEMSDEISELFTTFLQIVAVLVIVSLYSPFFTLLTMLALGVQVYIRNYADKKMNHYWLKTRREDDNYSSFIGQVANGLEEVRTFNMLPKLKQKLKLINRRYDKYYKQQRAAVNLRDIDVFYSYYIFKTFLYVLLVVFFMQGLFALDVLILIISYYETAFNYSNDLIDATNEIRLTDASVERISRILEYNPAEPYEFGRVSIEDLNGKIEFKNISLTINKAPILKNVSFKVKPREVVAIVGFPGAGKTMLFNLLLRLRRPTKGEILLDDIDIKDFSREIYTSSVAVANQTPFIFNTSIRDNLNFADPNIKNQISACKTAGIHDFIETLPLGYNTILRENASNVSGGQRQMISIARTILTDAEVLLLDDITTSLDPDTATFVPKLIKNLKKDHTVIMITKKPELMNLADRIIVMSHGKIEAVGKPNSLAEKSKTYRELQLISSSGKEEHAEN